MFKNGKAFYLNTETVLEMDYLYKIIKEHISRQFKNTVCPLDIAKIPMNKLLSS